MWACGYCLFSLKGELGFKSSLPYWFNYWIIQKKKKKRRHKLEKEVKILHVTYLSDRVPNSSKIERNSEAYSNQTKEMENKWGFWSIANEDRCEGSVSFTSSSANRKCESKNQKGRRLFSSFLQSFARVGGWFSYLW